MRYATYFASAVIALGLSSALHAADLVKMKDLGKFAGWRDNALVGYGIVTGLAGTGDSPTNKTTRQTFANVLSQFSVAVTPEQIQSRNVAIVMVSASLPPFAREGDTLDVTVTSAGDARSLLGGNLLLTPLKAANSVVYALAQGPLSVGGYRYDMNGNVVQKNHPTVGAVPNGATVEHGVSAHMLDQNGFATFVLASPDYTTAQRVANAVNQRFATHVAEPTDAEAIRIDVPVADRDHPVDFFSRLEALEIEPDTRAKVVVNERTGIVVSGGDVRISKVTIAHGDLKVSIVTDNEVVQPSFVTSLGHGIRTQTVSNSTISVREQDDTVLVTAEHNSVAELVGALNKLKTNTRDIIAILQAMKAADALHADLMIQ